MLRSTEMKALRKAAGMSQQVLADRVGCHWVTISRLERGVIEMTVGWQDRLLPQLVTDAEQRKEYARPATATRKSDLARIEAKLDAVMAHLGVTLDGDGE